MQIPSSRICGRECDGFASRRPLLSVVPCGIERVESFYGSHTPMALALAGHQTNARTIDLSGDRSAFRQAYVPDRGSLDRQRRAATPLPYELIVRTLVADGDAAVVSVLARVAAHSPRYELLDHSTQRVLVHSSCESLLRVGSQPVCVVCRILRRLNAYPVDVRDSFDQTYAQSKAHKAYDRSCIRAPERLRTRQGGSRS